MFCYDFLRYILPNSNNTLLVNPMKTYGFQTFFQTPSQSLGEFFSIKPEKTIAKYELKNKAHEKGYRNKPLSQEQKANNTKKSNLSLYRQGTNNKNNMEHVFGFTCLSAGRWSKVWTV